MNILKSSKKYLLTIGISFLVILAIVVLIVVIVENRKWKQTEEYKQQQIKKKYKDYLDVQALFLTSGQYLLYIDNISTDYLNINATLTFYDKDNNVLEEKKIVAKEVDNGITIKPFVLNIAKWDKYTLDYKLDNTVKVNPINKKQIGIYLDNKKKILEVTNDLDKDINHINIGIIYYSNGKIVGYQSHAIYDIQSGKKKDRYFLEPFDTITNKAIDYNTVKYSIEDIILK